MMDASRKLTTKDQYRPKVSVIMATYNGARYLPQAVESILTQTFVNFEFIIIDDGSTDQTSIILNSFQDPRIIRLKNEKNIGLTKSLNRGIQVSHGELIARQDADDISLPERLSCQVSFMDNHPEIGLLGTQIMRIDSEGHIIKGGSFYTDPIQLQQTLLTIIPFLHGTFIFRRVCLQDIGGSYNEEIPVAQDCDLLFRISEKWDIANLADTLYKFRQHENSVTSHRKLDQAHYLHINQDNAIKRRLAYGWGRLGLSRQSIPQWVRTADRRWLSERFVWWSAAARGIRKSTALQFLLLAFLIDVKNSSLSNYVKGILSRKILSIVNKSNSISPGGQ